MSPRWKRPQRRSANLENTIRIIFIFAIGFKNRRPFLLKLKNRHGEIFPFELDMTTSPDFKWLLTVETRLTPTDLDRDGTQ